MEEEEEEPEKKKEKPEEKEVGPERRPRAKMMSRDIQPAGPPAEDKLRGKPKRNIKPLLTL